MVQNLLGNSNSTCAGIHQKEKVHKGASSVFNVSQQIDYLDKTVPG